MKGSCWNIILNTKEHIISKFDFSKQFNNFQVHVKIKISKLIISTHGILQYMYWFYFITVRMLRSQFCFCSFHNATQNTESSTKL